MPEQAGQDLATGLPHSELLLSDDPSWRNLAGTIEGFIGRDVAVGKRADPHGLRTILFTDLEAHTEMMSRLGDHKGRAVLRAHEATTREALHAHGGAEIKSLGDGFMASFGSAQRALECAITLQRTLRQTQPELSVRVGINAGEPIEEEGDLFGASVIAAARISAIARGGQILVANVVRELVAGKGFAFADAGTHGVGGGLDDPVRVWELEWDQA